MSLRKGIGFCQQSEISLFSDIFLFYIYFVLVIDELTFTCSNNVNGKNSISSKLFSNMKRELNQKYNLLVQISVSDS